MTFCFGGKKKKKADDPYRGDNNAAHERIVALERELQEKEKEVQSLKRKLVEKEKAILYDKIPVELSPGRGGRRVRRLARFCTDAGGYTGFAAREHAHDMKRNARRQLPDDLYHRLTGKYPPPRAPRSGSGLKAPSAVLTRSSNGSVGEDAGEIK